MNNPIKILTGVIVILAVLLSFDISQSTQGPALANKYPQRIISLGPTNTENIYLLGAEDRLVANTCYCIRPEAAKRKEKIGSVMHVSIEKIISLKPDLVLATSLSSPQQLKKLGDLGVPVVQFKQAASFDEICDQFITTGLLLGLEELAQSLIRDVREKVATVRQEIFSLNTPKVFLQIGSEPLVGAIHNTFTHDFIVLAGGVNIIDDQFSGKTKYEKVISYDPDIIIIAIMGSESGLAGKEKERWQSIPVLKAVRDNRVHIIDPDMVCSPSPSTFAEALRTISRLIHPELNQEQ